MFQAGASHYGVADLKLLAQVRQTHGPPVLPSLWIYKLLRARGVC